MVKLQIRDRSLIMRGGGGVAEKKGGGLKLKNM